MTDCPQCSSFDTELMDTEHDNEYVVVEKRCRECGCRFHVLYEAIDVEILERGDL